MFVEASVKVFGTQNLTEGASRLAKVLQVVGRFRADQCPAGHTVIDLTVNTAPTSS